MTLPRALPGAPSSSTSVETAGLRVAVYPTTHFSRACCVCTQAHSLRSELFILTIPPPPCEVWLARGLGLRGGSQGWKRGGERRAGPPPGVRTRSVGQLNGRSNVVG